MWGYNTVGQLGIGPATVNSTSTTYIGPTQLFFSTGTVVTHLAAGYVHSAAIDSTSQLWMWGENNFGQLGIGSDINQPSPVAVDVNYTAVSLGFHHTCALKGTQLYCWGQDSECELAPASPANSPIPSEEMPYYVSNLMDVAAVACGAAFTVALRSDGTVWFWGANYTFVGHNQVNATPSCVPSKVNLPKLATKVSVGGYHTCALLVDNTVYCWGDNSNGEVGDDESTYTHSNQTPVMVVGSNNFTDINIGLLTSFAFVPGNALYGWGWDGDCGMLNVTGNRGDQLTPKLLPGLPSGIALLSKGSISRLVCAVLNN